MSPIRDPFLRISRSVLSRWPRVISIEPAASSSSLPAIAGLDVGSDAELVEG